MGIRAVGSWRRVAGVALLVGVVAACGGNSPKSAPTTAAPSGETTVTTAAPVFTNAPTTVDPKTVPVSGGSLTVGLPAESPGYNPTSNPWSDAGHNVARAIFDPLATYDAGGKVVPYLAESITPNADATVWTITLRKGITFHDGEALDATAVQTNLAASKANPQFGGQLTLLGSMKVVDPLTLEVTMTKPWATFPNLLVGNIGSQIGYMAAPKMLASPDGARNPVGTGPFKFKEWVPDDHLTVVRNDSYWQKPALLDQIVFKPIPDSTARKAAIDAGDIDVYYTGSSKEITEYQASEKDGKVNVTIGAPSDPDVVMLNTKIAPLDDVRVRRALAMATDMPRVFKFLDATGVKQPMHGPYADNSFWYTKSNYPDLDVAGAKKLIDAYVAEKGKPVVLEFSGNQSPFTVSYLELFQSMWADIGVKVNIVSRAQGENINAVIGGKYQVISWGGIGGGDPDNDYNAFHSGTGQNFTNFNTPAMDAALDAGRATADPAKRKEQYAIVQQILGDNVPFIWTGSNQFGVVTKPTVHGVANFTLPDGSVGQPITGGEFFLKDVWREK